MVIIRSASWRFSELAEPENLPRGAENEHISGIRVIQGCDCGVHPGRRAENRPHSADSVQRGDAGDLQPPRLHGVLLYKTRSDLKVGPSRRSMLVRERISNQEILRAPIHVDVEEDYIISSSVWKEKV
ncbi:uncharacterized protein LOC118530557 isoform X9 [Halichoerus grypus]|uniref:uncharacterized protein LOC118530557 isoform X2 n=1 Tax=Halichoerus grypus TaxID=9711 RepID=UPI0016592131|nr:uncharacterized protein LOC118530557 isoform X2 [Halichoerus grypus]